MFSIAIPYKVLEMPGEVLTVVRMPMSEIAEEVKRQYSLSDVYAYSRIEGDVLVLYFSKTLPTSRGDQAPSRRGILEVSSSVTRQPRRSPKGKRLRMKTRGWTVVDRFENSKGQTTLIYKPFVDALKEKGLTQAQQKSQVADILKANGNRPGPGSIDYFWMNTVEYLRKQAETKVAETKEA